MKQYSEALVNAFMTCHKVKDIAKTAGVSVATVNRYKNDAEFMSVLNERRAEMVSAAVDKMTATLVEDVEVLQKVISNDEVNPAVRITAINTKWSHLREWRLLSEFDKRLRAIERANISENERF